MPNINVLDSDTINKIAAGEVVERPSSVVKELVENAIDAKATAITVEIRDGGTSLIRITDNGCGIEKEDIPLAFLRHSTSKIKSVEDLLVVSSLGFRGEALSSIASVAQVELITKPASNLTGVRYLIDGGVEKSIEEIGCPNGTTIIVRNLFYNTPARRKFLKASMTEAGYVNDLLMRLALSHPEISFKFINNGQNKLHTAGNMQLKDIIYNVYGRDITANLLEIQNISANMKISGYIGKPIISRGNRAFENYFINGRYIKSPIITKAIEEAYKNFVMVHKYPFTAFHLEIDSSYIDVNVHPTKMEIRFTNNDEVYQLVYRTIRDALSSKELIVNVSLDTPKEHQEKAKEEAKALYKAPLPEPFEVGRKALLNNPNVSKQKPYTPAPVSKPTIIKNDVKPITADITYAKPVLNQNESVLIQPIVNKTEDEKPFKKEECKKYIKEEQTTYSSKPEQLELFSEQLLTKEARIHHKLIGQVFNTYWLVEFDGKLFIIDQHAAHEKVMYEKLIRQFKNNTPVSQYLQPPIIVSLTMNEENVLKQYLDKLNELGFEIEHFGGNEYALRAVPSELYGYSERDLFIDLMDSLCTESGRIHTNLIEERIATMACKAAVKGNQNISFAEADTLIDELLKAENPYNCPHGRPTIISMTKYELEKKFKRIQ